MILKKFISLFTLFILIGITSVLAQSPSQIDTVYLQKSCKQVQSNIDTSKYFLAEIMNMLKAMDQRIDTEKKVIDIKKPD